MSNRSILDRLLEKVADYEQEIIKTSEFCSFLRSSIEALEALPFSKIKEMRDFEYRLEIASFHEEEECISDKTSVLHELKEWISKLKNTAEQGAAANP